MVVVTGDVFGAGGEHVVEEIWRVPFLGWGEPHRMIAPRWCRPRRFTVLDGPEPYASGDTPVRIVPAGEIFTFAPEAPEP